jgi:hypothetical protein
MYTVSDVVEIGEARELILAELKELSVRDDDAEVTMEPLEFFDE